MKRNKIYHSTWLNFFKEFQFLRKKNLLQRTVRPSSRDSFDYLRLSFEINLTPLASPKFMPSRFKQFLTKKPEPFTEQKSQRSGWRGDDSLIICFFFCYRAVRHHNLWQPRYISINSFDRSLPVDPTTATQLEKAGATLERPSSLRDRRHGVKTHHHSHGGGEEWEKWSKLVVYTYFFLFSVFYMQKSKFEKM